jgi:hypothetical protein
VGLQVERVGVGQQPRQTLGDLGPVALADSDFDTGARRFGRCAVDLVAS